MSPVPATTSSEMSETASAKAQPPVQSSAAASRASTEESPEPTARPPSTLSVSPSTPPPITIGRRMCAATGWTIFGLLFFYIVMVALSAISKKIVMARIPHDGWARTASRQTGGVSAVVFVMFLVCDKRKMFSLIAAVQLACAQFCHFVIVSSDVRAYVDEEVLVQMTRREGTHRLLGMLPLEAMWVLGSVGFLSCLVLVNERVFGNALKERRAELPVVSRVCVGWLVGLYALYYVDNFLWVLGKDRFEAADLLYPIFFLLLLLAGATYRLAERAAATPVVTRNADEKKKQ